MSRKALALAALATGCTGTVGTVTVSLTTAPGSHVLDSVETLRMIVTSPHHVTTAARSPSGGFTIAIDLPATGDAGALIVDGLDAAGTVVATGASPRFPVGAINAHLAVYMAAPDSIAAAPAMLAIPRTDIAIGTLGYGAILAGGLDSAHAASDTMSIYNTYDHSLVGGLPLPAARAGVVVATGANGIVYLFGGTDDAGNPTGTAWRFDTNAQPSGAYLDLGDKTGFARSDQVALPLGSDQFLISGTPPAELAGLDGSMVARSEIAALPPAGAAVIASDGVATLIYAGPSGVVRVRGGTFTPVDAPAAARTASVVALPGGKVLVVCGGADAIEIDAATGAATTIPNLPATPRTGCAAVATGRHLVIAGGTLASGDVAATAEVYDAATLAPVATPSLVVPRTAAAAVALPNDQVLIASGADATGAPIATLELFTPASLE